MTSTAEADLSKVVFNPSKSVTFIPVNKKQAVVIEVTNNCACPVAVKFKNTAPTLLRTKPSTHKLMVGEKMAFTCIFKGEAKEKCKPKHRFTVVYMATTKHANISKTWNAAHKTATRKHMIQVLFQGINDQKEGETQQPSGNNEEEEDKDRQGHMRSKAKSEMKTAQNKKATVVMFTRKEGESLSDEDDEKEEGADESMMTVRPAGVFTGQVNPNAAKETPPSDDLKTVRPAGVFTGQKGPNGVKAANSATDLRTTRPAGAFTGQTAVNAKGPTDAELKTTKPAGEFKGQATPNVPSPNPDMKTTKNAGPFENQQTPNR